MKGNFVFSPSSAFALSIREEPITPLPNLTANSTENQTQLALGH
jgi:hypothetical protein